jgi:hypothetical protein
MARIHSRVVRSTVDVRKNVEPFAKSACPLLCGLKIGRHVERTLKLRVRNYVGLRMDVCATAATTYRF